MATWMLPMFVKIHHVDRVAWQKGFRRNHVYPVVGAYMVSDPRRTPMLIVENRKGGREGFYADQYRKK